MLLQDTEMFAFTHFLNIENGQQRQQIREFNDLPSL